MYTCAASDFVILISFLLVKLPPAHLSSASYAYATGATRHNLSSRPSFLLVQGAIAVGGHIFNNFPSVFLCPLYTSSLYIESLKRVEELTGKKVEFVELDLLDEPGLKKLFADHDFGAVIHFAGLKVCFG